MIKTVGVGLAACLALAGCGSDVPGGRSSPNSFTGPVKTPSPTVTVTVAGKTVTVTPKATGPATAGQVCEIEGFVAKNSAGRQVRCVKKTGEKKTLWVIDAGADPDGTVRPGEQCPAAGATGHDGGVNYTCTRGAGGQNRWRPA
ncbi:hypothetical protein EDD29_1716 [Actinocorallia herbida]|uniref:Ig-like domain-containing protein n=1 Tax=Actinocorallia herbida TaxID=58109 RepID=A0A3N1CU27_9ACTN|nr:hypothetical protein [Actinocorallia herbida]ROO84198.1 hypothetical protein EDD29_1716 [Actinocorallia herbida]